MTSVATFFKAGRKLVFDAVQELQDRVNVLIASAQVSANALVTELITTTFSIVRASVASTFSLLRAGLIIVLGLPYTSVIPADYAVGFEDGRRGMVPAKPKKK